MKKITYFILSLLLFGQTHVMAHEWKVDPIHTSILFEVKHIYSTVRGQFSDFTGNVFFDPDNLEKSKIDFVVKVDSINTNNGKRDNHLRSNDFFATSKYPVMTFKSSRVSRVNGNKYALEGKLTIKDVTKDMRLEFIYWGQKENPFKKDEMIAGFDTHFNVDRLNFHVGNGKFYKMGVVGKNVDILITVEASRKK
jgi:polyisoprenoid-binding protein YceI